MFKKFEYIQELTSILIILSCEFEMMKIRVRFMKSMLN